MRAIHVDEDTYQKLAVSARLMDRTIGEVVCLLVQRLVSEEPSRAGRVPTPAPEQPRAGSLEGGTSWVQVYKIYKANRVDGSFNPSTMELRIATAPWSGQVFASPTAAALAVVDQFSGDTRQTSNTNGRKFWRLTGGGGDLRSIVGTRF